MGKNNCKPVCCSNLQSGHSNRDIWKKIVQLQRFVTTRFSFFFAYGPYNNIHKFKGCFLRGQVSLNGFKVFNGCILVRLQKNLRIFFSQKTLWLDNLLPSVPVWVSGLSVRTVTSLVLTVLLPTVILLKGFSDNRLLAAATQINANNQGHN